MQQAHSTDSSNDILSQMDVILPAQYFGSLGSARFSSEQRLMLAVLARISHQGFISGTDGAARS